jgi:Tol biopolymer transport system component
VDYELLASPDGAYIALNDTGIMVIVDRHGDEVMRLAAPVTSFSGIGPFASWSQDSDRFAYTRLNIADTAAPQTWIDVVDVRNGQVITPGALKQAVLGQPSWAPDGKHLVAVGAANSNNDDAPLILIDAATGASSTLVDRPNAGKILPLWSPDGKSIAYWLPDGYTEHAGGPTLHQFGALAIADANGGNARFLADAGSVTPSVWSPDSRQLVATCGPDKQASAASAPRNDVCLIDAHNGSRTLLTTDGTSGAAQFSPDGRSVAYLTTRMGREARR